MNLSHALRLSKVASLAVSLAFAATQVSAQTAGVVEEAINNVTASLNGATRSVNVNAEVIRNEVIRTAAASSTRIRFIDDSVLEIGPFSEITLNEFIYNPNTNEGNFNMTVQRGLVRFASGLQPSSNYAVNTPVATIGIRGTTIVISQLSNGTFSFAIEEGSADVDAVTPEGQSISINLDATTQQNFVTTTIGGARAGETPPLFQGLNSIFSSPQGSPTQLTNALFEAIGGTLAGETCVGDGCEQAANRTTQTLTDPSLSPFAKDRAIQALTVAFLTNDLIPDDQRTGLLNGLGNAVSDPELREAIVAASDADSAANAGQAVFDVDLASEN